MQINEIRFIQTRGMIIKEEKVKSLTDKTLGNFLVLENYEPFPGYFGNSLPHDVKPRSIFLLLSKEMDDLQLARILQGIDKEKTHKCHATTGWINFMANRFQCIRLKNLSCFSETQTIAERLKDRGVDLLKYKQIDENVLIHLNKTFSVELKTPELMVDLYDNSIYYFTINHELSWKDFVVINRNVKNNLKNNSFDAAIGFFWTFEGPQDIVRIYDAKADINRIKELHDKYNLEIERWYKEKH